MVLVDLTAANDTVWHQGLMLKLPRMIPDKHLVRFITNILATRSFVLTTSDRQHSRLRRLRNSLLQGCYLSPLLFNVYISDLPKPKLLQCGYADNLALFYSHQRWRTIEETLTTDVEHVAEYFLSCGD